MSSSPIGVVTQWRVKLSTPRMLDGTLHFHERLLKMNDISGHDAWCLESKPLLSKPLLSIPLLSQSSQNVLLTLRVSIEGDAGEDAPKFVWNRTENGGSEVRWKYIARSESKGLKFIRGLTLRRKTCWNFVHTLLTLKSLHSGLTASAFRHNIADLWMVPTSPPILRNS